MAVLSEDLEDWPSRSRPGELTYLPRHHEDAEPTPEDDTTEEQ